METTTERFELQLTPHGVVAALPYGGGDRWAEGVASRFADGEEAGLVALAAATIPAAAHVSVSYWREVAAEFVRTLCHLPESAAPSPEAMPPPPETRFAEWVLSAPPMRGAEYLSAPVLGGVWERLEGWAIRQAQDCGGLSAFLEVYAPQWTRVGRVTLHLAEHKGDEEYPFAFMATYAAGLSRGGRMHRLPLGRALQAYAGAGKKPELLKLLSPLHEAGKRSRLIGDLIESGDIFHPLVWTPAEAHAFLKEIPIYEECGLIAQLPNWWRKRSRPRVNVTLDTRKKAALGKDAILNFDLALALGDENLSREEAEHLLQQGDGLVRLRGEWVEVDGEKLREVLAHWEQIEQRAGADGLSFIEGMRLLAGASADLRDGGRAEDVESWSRVRAGDELRRILAGMRAPGDLQGTAPKGFHGNLRPYQVDGMNWLRFCFQLGLGSCLADDMGLGKTIQVLAALLRDRQGTGRNGSAPSLLVVPASLIGNWKAETARFAPDIRLTIAHPSETPRQLLDSLAADPSARLQDTDLVITTYSMISRMDWLSTIHWRWLILDEAQAIKNPSTRQTREVKKLQADARTALTGTPVENRLGDLWSIFDFLNPGLLGSAKRFKSFVSSLEAGKQPDYAPLRNLVSPYILRRLKTDPAIAPDLPDKTEMQVFCGLAKPQAVLYRQGVAELAKALKDPEVDGINRRGLVLSFLMRFKQICNHPSQLTGDGVYDPTASAKFDRLGSLCAEIASRGEKALIFTQFREITGPLAEFLSGVFGREGLVLHGGTAVRKRQDLVADFQREAGPPFFVMSIKAGGTGLNLTAASHVIHFDRWWNPAVENQATDRAFRIGQQRNVLVHKFVTRGTIEERIDALIREKQALADAVFDGGGEIALTEMSDEEILEMVSLDLERAGGEQQ